MPGQDGPEHDGPERDVRALDMTSQDVPVNGLPGQDRPVQGVLQAMITKGRGFVPFCLSGDGFMAFAYR